MSDQHLVFDTLKQYFFIQIDTPEYLTLAMPSKVVDDLWHEFILNTKEYDKFCQNAFGYFLDYTPIKVTNDSRHVITSSMNIMWCLACFEEDISGENPHKLPLLFSIDEKLSINNGYYYTLDSTPENDTKIVHCMKYMNCNHIRIKRRSFYADFDDSFGGDGGDGGGGDDGGC